MTHPIDPAVVADLVRRSWSIDSIAHVFGRKVEEIAELAARGRALPPEPPPIYQRPKLRYGTTRGARNAYMREYMRNWRARKKAAQADAS